MEAKELIRIRNLNVSFGKLEVLKNLNLTIHEGEVFGVIGMSGVGKTTLLLTIVGFLKPTSGEVSYNYNGSFITKDKNPRFVKEIFGFSTQDPSFYPELTVKQNLAYFASLYKLSPEVRKENVKRALELVGLEEFENVEAGRLSGGMKKRLDIACSIIHRPKILLLDEPTADLDPITREKIWELVKKINSIGTTIIIASHFLQELESVCSRIAVLKDKRIFTMGSAGEIKRYSRNKILHIRTQYGRYDILVEKLKKMKLLEIKRIDETGEKLVITTPNIEKTLQEVRRLAQESNDKILNVKIVEPTLREVFEELVNNGKK